MLAYIYTTLPLLYDILILIILSQTSFSIISVQTKEQTQKLEVCCLAHPCDSCAPAILGTQASPKTAEAL